MFYLLDKIISLSSTKNMCVNIRHNMYLSYSLYPITEVSFVHKNCLSYRKVNVY